MAAVCEWQNGKFIQAGIGRINLDQRYKFKIIEFAVCVRCLVGPCSSNQYKLLVKKSGNLSWNKSRTKGARTAKLL